MIRWMFPLPPVGNIGCYEKLPVQDGFNHLFAFKSFFQSMLNSMAFYEEIPIPNPVANSCDVHPSFLINNCTDIISHSTATFGAFLWGHTLKFINLLAQAVQFFAGEQIGDSIGHLAVSVEPVLEVGATAVPLH